MEDLGKKWKPTRFVRFINALGTNMLTAEILTDSGRAYMKPMNKNSSPHGLAVEIIGTRLARRIGLKTPDYAVLYLDESDEIPLHDGSSALPGPAFVSRALKAIPWNGDKAILAKILNPNDLGKIIVFDTWTLNCDRFLFRKGKDTRKGFQWNPNYRNLLLEQDLSEQDRFMLIAIDHGHCFTYGQELTSRLNQIDRINSDCIYGLYPQFSEIVTLENIREALKSLSEISKEEIKEIVFSDIPREWDVHNDMKESLVDFLFRRAEFLCQNFEEMFSSVIHPQDDLDLS